MKQLFAGGTCAAVTVAFGMVAFAQPTAQTPAQPPAPSPAQTVEQSPAPAADAQKAPMEQVTIVGCVQREADYRRARDAGRGGVAGTGLGVGNEYVLVNASRAIGASTDKPAGTTGGTTAGAPGADAYELTGENEAQVGQHVGKRVEIVGKLKPAETGPTGTTGGATAGAPPRGIDITSPDLKLRELEVISVRETTGACPAMQR